jgi:hypothetical protein
MPEMNDLKYEARDLNPRAVVWFTVGLAILAVLVLIAMAGLMRLLSRGELPGQGVVPPGRTSIIAIDRSPQPDLQVSPIQDLQRMRSIEDAQLRNYGWIDRQAGIAAIPIERAMELLAERGLLKVHVPEKKAVQDTKEVR